MARWALAILVIASGVCAQPRAAARPPVHIKTAAELTAAIARVEAIFAEEHTRDSLASVTVGLVSGPELVWTKSWGMADMEAHRPATKDTTYRIGSITKQITALMLLQQVALGKVHFSDPVEKYYPEVNQVAGRYTGAPPITLIQLATHTAGLDREPGDIATYTKGPVAAWEKTLLAALSKLKYDHEPGTRYMYSNIGYAILGAALSRVAGQPYIDYVRARILKPLDMTHTAFEPDDRMRPMLAKGYILRNGAADPEPAARELRDGRGYKVPNGALFTTVGDLARFVSFEMGDGPEAVLKRDIVLDNLTRTSSATGDLSSGYGVGFMLQRKGDLIAAGHGGSVAGYVAGAYFNPANHTGIIFLRNADSGPRSSVVMAALEALAK